MSTRFLDEYFASVIRVAKEGGAKGFVLDTPTFRSTTGWAQKIGMGEDELRV